MIKLIKRVLGINEIKKTVITNNEKSYYEELLKHYELELSIIKRNPNGFTKEEKDKMTNLVGIYKAKLGEL
jgi:hypothetical protein